MKFVFYLFFCVCGFTLFAQNSKPPADWVIIRHSTDIEMLNPIINTSPKIQAIHQFVFASLNGVHPKTLEVIPFLANLPEKSEDGKTHTYQIKQDAVWGDGTPITGEDVEFTLKVIKNPKVKSSRLRYMYQHVTDVKIDKNDNKKFRVIYNNPNSNVATLKILPKHIFDAENLMGKFSISELTQDTMNIINNPKIIRFSEQFNDEQSFNKMLFNAAASSGPYYFTSCKPTEELILQRKDNWWGDNYYSTPGELFVANPKKIIYKVVKDLKLTMTMFSIQDLDVVYDLPSKEFLELTKKDSNYFKYKLRTSNTLEYLFVGINTKKEGLLSDVEFRKALCLSIDVDYFLNHIAKEWGRRLTCPGIPEKKIGYNEKIPLLQPNPEQSIKILEKLGYTQTDEDGFRYKTDANNKKEYIQLELKIIEGNHEYRKIAHYISEAFKQIGVQLQINEASLAEHTQKLNKRDFDMYLGKVTEGIGITNPYISWHTKSASNITGFGNAITDALIEKVLKEKDSQTKKQLYDSFQEMIMEHYPIILLWSPQSKIAINSRFQNVNSFLVTAYYLGFNPAAFYTPTELVRYK